MMKNRALLIFRIFALAICLFAMGFRLIIDPILGDGWIQLLDTLGYFTIQTGLMVTIVFATLLISQITGNPKIAPPARIRGAVLLYTIIVTVIFWVMIRQRVGFTGVSNLILHMNAGLTAILIFIDNILSIKPLSYKWTDLLLWLIYPISYMIFSIIEGLIFGRFRHFFFNFYNSGLSYYILTMFLLLVFISGVGAMIIFFNRIYRKPNNTLSEETQS